MQPLGGWYPDPTGRAAQRYWSGVAWTDWVSDGTTVRSDGRPAARPMTPSDAEHLMFVRTVFLPEALGLGLIDNRQLLGLSSLSESLLREAREADRVLVAAGPARPLGPPPTTVFAPPGQVAAEVSAPAPVPVAPPRVVTEPHPGPVGRWWARTREAVGSDLAVHGLAYLGVLLLFVGVFGLVAFAFGDVAVTVRPVAELSIAVAPFLAAVLLLRRGAVVAGRALELGGGLLLPIMAMTGFLDGVGMPPDLDGTTLVVVLAAVLGAVSLGYVVWTRRHAASALRFLVAPVAWLAVGVSTMGLGRAIPSGKAVASITAAQVSAIVIAMAVSFALARLRPSARLSAPTLTAGVPGVFLVGLLSPLTWFAAGWPVLPVAVTGVAGLLVLDLLDVRLTDQVVAMLEPLWWAVVALALVPGLEPGPAGAVAALGFVALLENNGHRRPAPWPLGLTGGLALAAGAATWAEPWWTMVGCALAAVWAVWRRRAPYQVIGAPVALDAAAAILPVASVLALGAATEQPAVATAVGAGLVLLATLPATRPVLRRGPDDAFWPRWWEAAVVGLAGVLGVLVASWWPTSTQDQWLVTGSVAALALAVGLGPVAAVWRPWPVLALGTWAWVMACATLSAPDVVRGAVVAAVALSAVVVAHPAGEGMSARPAGSLGLAGHGLGLFALATGGSGWGLVAVVALATAGWLVTTWSDARDSSPVGSMLGAAAEQLRYLPPVLAAVGMPTVVVLTLDAASLLRWSDPWAPAVLAATGLTYALLARLPAPTRISVTLAWAAFTAAVSGAMLGVQSWPTIAGLVAVVAAVLALPPSRRAAPMVWVAWAALAPLVGVLATETMEWFAELGTATAAATCLIVVGGVLVVGALAIDLRGRPWQPCWRPALPAALPAFAVGALEMVAGLLTGWSLARPPANGWLTVGAAAVSLVAAVLARTGVLGGVAAGLGWVGVLLLAGPTIGARPWISILAVVVLLAAAELAGRGVADRRWWARWDLPAFLAANLAAATALAAAVDGDSRPATFVVVGLLAMGVAVRMRALVPIASAYASAGVLLVLVGAGDAGPGWLALALLALSATVTTLAVRAEGPLRGWLQVGGALAAAGAWQQAVVWLDVAPQRSMDLTVVVAGIVALAWATAVRVRPSLRSWALAWGAVASTTVGVVVLVTTVAWPAGSPDANASSAMVGGLLLLAAGWGVGARPVSLGGMRDVAAGLLLAAQLEGFLVWDASAGWQVTVLAATAIGCAIVALAMPRDSVMPTWRRPVLELGVAAALASLVVAGLQLPETALLVPALLVAAAQAAAVGVALRSVWVRALAPLLACAAWLVFAAEARGSQPQWYTVPIGLALLVVVALVRADARARGADIAARGIVILELVGIGFLVGAAFVQAVSDVWANAALALGLGLAIAGWGLVTKVRRRVAAGVVIVVAAVVVMIAVPLAQPLPGWEGAGLWLYIAGAGLVALLAAALLEKGKAAVRRVTAGFAEMTREWE